MKMCIDGRENFSCSVSDDTVAPLQGLPTLSGIAFPSFQMFACFINFKCEDFCSYIVGF